MEEPQFLTWEIVLQLHADSLRKFGGLDGIGSPGLVESALASAQNTWLYANGDLFDIAATYAFHIAEAQAFVDGNKRTAMAAALVFLAGNSTAIKGADETLYKAMIAIAEKRLDKKGLAALFRNLAQEQAQ